MSDSSLPQLLTIDEVARILQVSKKTLHRWERSGRIKSVRTPGNQRRFKRWEVEHIFKKHPHKIKERSSAVVYRVPYSYVHAYKALFLLIVTVGFGGITIAIGISHSTYTMDQKISLVSGKELSLQSLMADRGLEQNRIIQLAGEIPMNRKKPWLSLDKIGAEPIIESQSQTAVVQSRDILSREHNISRVLNLPGEPQMPVSVEKLGTKTMPQTSLE